MSETSLHSGDALEPERDAAAAGSAFMALAPYAALSVIAGIVFGTLSTHPF